jgi:hypothetical protein
MIATAEKVKQSLEIGANGGIYSCETYGHMKTKYSGQDSNLLAPHEGLLSVAIIYLLLLYYLPICLFILLRKIFSYQIGVENLKEKSYNIGNNAKFCYIQNLIFKSIMFSHCDLYKFACPSPSVKTYNKI